MLASIPAFAAFLIFVNRPVEGAWPAALARVLARYLSMRTLLRTGAVVGAGVLAGGVLHFA